MLPPGPHFACYSIPGKQQHGGGMAPVSGFFFVVPEAGQKGVGGGRSQQSVLVRRYDPQQELLVEMEEAEVRTAGGVELV